MKKLSLLFLLPFLTACNITSFNRIDTVDGVTTKVHLVNYRCVWSTDMYKINVYPGYTSVSCVKSKTDPESMKAFMEGAVEGTVMGLKGGL